MEHKWWHGKTAYQIYPKSFCDSNGDGIGDLRGIINRLDYLNDGDINSGKSLGVQGIWLSPIFKSPSYHKYDATDYYTIDPKFGTEEDLKELLELCHQRNVKVILDLAINHTAKDNAWFTWFSVAHANGDTESEYYDFYSWAPRDGRKSGITYLPIPGCGADQWYECNFSSDMPELLGMCDRLMVLKGGKKTGVLERDEFSQEKVLKLAL